MSQSPSQPSAATIYHVEDDLYFSDIVAQLLRKWPEVRQVGCAATAMRGLAECRRLRPEIVLLDLWLPDEDGYMLVDQLVGAGYHPRVVLLSARNDPLTLSRLRFSAVFGMLWKSSDLHVELRAALNAVSEGRRYLSPGVQQAYSEFRASPTAFTKILTDRELALVPHFATGARDEEIAAEAGISPNTSRRHRQNIMSKLGLHRTLDLVTWALATGFGMRKGSGAPTGNISDAGKSKI